MRPPDFRALFDTAPGLFLVLRYKGRIWAESEPGTGSPFFIALPSADSQTEFGEKTAEGSEG